MAKKKSKPAAGREKIARYREVQALVQKANQLSEALPSPNLDEAYQPDGNQPLFTLDTHLFDLHLSGVGKSQSVYQLLSFWSQIITSEGFFIPGQVIWVNLDVIPDLEDSTE